MHYTFTYGSDGKVTAHGVLPPAADNQKVGDTMSTETVETQASPRTFHSSDYARAAHMIRRMRQVKGNPFQGKDQPHQDKIAGITLMLAAIFEQDALESGKGGAFDKDRFVAGTQLPVFDPQAPGNEPWSGGEDNGAFGEDGEVI